MVSKVSSYRSSMGQAHSGISDNTKELILKTFSQNINKALETLRNLQR